MLNSHNHKYTLRGGCHPVKLEENDQNGHPRC